MDVPAYATLWNPPGNDGQKSGREGRTVPIDQLNFPCWRIIRTLSRITRHRNLPEDKSPLNRNWWTTVVHVSRYTHGSEYTRAVSAYVSIHRTRETLRPRSGKSYSSSGVRRRGVLFTCKSSARGQPARDPCKFTGYSSLFEPEGTLPYLRRPERRTESFRWRVSTNERPVTFQRRKKAFLSFFLFSLDKVRALCTGVTRRGANSSNFPRFVVYFARTRDEV